MKSIATCAFVLLVLSSVSCKKEEEEPAKAPSYWHIGDKNHNGELATRVAVNGLEAKESITELITVYFSAYPGSSKDYKIVNYNKIGSLASNECAIKIDNAGDLLLSTGYDNKKAGIAISVNGKITIAIPQTTARRYTNGVPTVDSTTIDGFMTEK